MNQPFFIKHEFYLGKYNWKIRIARFLESVTFQPQSGVIIRKFHYKVIIFILFIMLCKYCLNLLGSCMRICINCGVIVMFICVSLSMIYQNSFYPQLWGFISCSPLKFLIKSTYQYTIQILFYLNLRLSYVLSNCLVN